MAAAEYCSAVPADLVLGLALDPAGASDQAQVQALGLVPPPPGSSTPGRTALPVPVPHGSCCSIFLSLLRHPPAYRTDRRISRFLSTMPHSFHSTYHDSP